MILTLLYVLRSCILYLYISYTYVFLILYYIYNELSVTYFHFLQEIKSNQTWKSLGNQKRTTTHHERCPFCTIATIVYTVFNWP